MAGQQFKQTGRYGNYTDHDERRHYRSGRMYFPGDTDLETQIPYQQPPPAQRPQRERPLIRISRKHGRQLSSVGLTR